MLPFLNNKDTVRIAYLQSGTHFGESKGGGGWGLRNRIKEHLKAASRKHHFLFSFEPFFFLSVMSIPEFYLQFPPWPISICSFSS